MRLGAPALPALPIPHTKKRSTFPAEFVLPVYFHSRSSMIERSHIHLVSSSMRKQISPSLGHNSYAIQAKVHVASSRTYLGTWSWTYNRCRRCPVAPAELQLNLANFKIGNRTPHQLAASMEL